MTNFTIHPDTVLGPVHLTISNLARSLDFYQHIIGFKLHRRTDNMAYLDAGQNDLLVLAEQPQVKRPRDTTGLYHFAILVPTRFELAQSLKRIAETRTPVEGFADHLVSEAIYLPDPDGNGIEIYRDRPRSEWKYPNGQLRMGADPLNIENLLGELEGHEAVWSGLQAETTIGHIHLHVANIPQAEAFYQGVLGFDLIMRYGPSASFLSAGGYHHHIGVNTWAGKVPPPPDAAGLRYFVIRLPNANALNDVADNVRQAGTSLEERDEGLFLRDPVQNGIVLTSG